MRNYTLICCSLFVALCLTLLPMPGWTAWLRPAWLLMFVIYWTLAVPQWMGMGTAFCAGLVLDLFTGTVLGEHALAMTVVIYFVANMYFRIRTAPLVQQAISILVFILIYQILLFCIQGFVAELPRSPLYWLASFTSMLLWPWLFILLRDYRRRFKIA